MRKYKYKTMYKIDSGHIYHYIEKDKDIIISIRNYHLIEHFNLFDKYLNENEWCKKKLVFKTYGKSYCNDYTKQQIKFWKDYEKYQQWVSETTMGGWYNHKLPKELYEFYITLYLTLWKAGEVSDFSERWEQIIEMVYWNPKLNNIFKLEKYELDFYKDYWESKGKIKKWKDGE